MAKLTIIFAVTLVSVAQCAVLNNKDGALKRTARSPCYTCGGKGDFNPPPPPPPIHPPPPPPPPPVLQTENWSGLARSADGLQNAVFSGAAAAAKQGAQASGEAFSLASSTVDAGASLGNGHASGYGGATGSIGGSIGAKHEIGAGIRADGQVSEGGHGFGGYSGGSYKESHSYHSGNGKIYNSDAGSQQSYSHGAGFGSASQSEQNGGFADGSGSQQSYSHGAGFGSASKLEQNGGFNGRSGSSYSHGKGFESASQSEQSGGFNGGSDSQGYGGSISAGHGRKEGFGDFHNSETQQVQSGAFGASSGPGYLNKNDAGVGKGGYNSFSHGGSRSFEQHGGRYLANGERDQEGHGSFSSSQSQSFGRNFGAYGHGGGQYTNTGRSFDQPSQDYEKAHEEGVSQLQSSGFGSSGQEEIQKAGHSGSQFGASGSSGFETGASGSSGLEVGASGTGDAHSALSGALNLASQGVQASQHAAAGCTTCGKSSYALSNAKSYSGSAVALSIGG